MGALALVEPRPGRIPFAAIDHYAQRYGIEGSGFDLLLTIVGVVDLEYLAIEGEKARERAAQKD